MSVDLALFEWPDGPDSGPRLLGRITDPDLIRAAQERLAARHRRALRQLDTGLRAVPEELSEDEGE